MIKEYEITTTNGIVNALLRAGNDFVKTRITLAAAEDIVRKGEITDTVDPMFPLGIDNKWFFEAQKCETNSTTPVKAKKGVKKK